MESLTHLKLQTRTPMRKIDWRVACLLMVLLPTLVSAQDVHFTQFRMAPLTLNPASTGAFSGSYRLGGLYRDQWSTYGTASFYVDSPITKGLRDQDWIGVGGVFISDRASVSDFEGASPKAGSLKRSGFIGSVAYHLALDKKQTRILSAGVKVGSMGLKLEDDFRFESEIVGGGNMVEDLPGPQDDGKSFLDISAGLTLSGRTPKTNTYYKLGFSVNHIAAQRVSLLQTGSGSGGGRGGSNQPMWIIVHGDYGFDVSDNLLVDAGVLGQFLGGAREVSAQARVGYRVKNKSTVVYGGLGYRLGDAAALLLGLDYKQFRAGLAYDLTLSSLSTPNNAVELAVSFIGNIYKRPKIDPVIFCPRF